LWKGPGGWNDPDMLEVGNGVLSYDENKMHFSMWAIMKAPLIIGADLRSIDKKSLSILLNKELINVSQDKLGIQARRVWTSTDNAERGYMRAMIPFQGFLESGSDIQVAQMTVAEAKVHCLQIANCTGFTYQEDGTLKDKELSHRIYFKSNNVYVNNPSWLSYYKPGSPLAPGAQEIWTGNLQDNELVVTLLNRDNETANIKADWTTIGIKEGQAMSVRDLWAHKDLGVFTDEIEAEVNPHGVQVYRLSPHVNRNNIPQSS